MDPTTAYRTMTDWDAHAADRLEAAHALADWIEAGGFLPAGPWSTAPQRRARILADCAAIIAAAGRLDVAR